MPGAGAPAGVVDAVQEQLEGQREVYIDLHAHPELSMHETRTSGIIAERLEGFGFEVQRLGGGVVGVLANGQGPVVMTRADFDALPVEERTGLDNASTETTTDEDGRAGLAGLTRSPTRAQLRSPSALRGCEGAASSVRVEESLIGRRHCAGADGPGTRTI